MNKLIAQLLLLGLLIVLLSNCSNEPEHAEKKETAKVERSIDSMYAGWQTAEGEKITFRYPGNWMVKIKNLPGDTKMFGLIEKTNEDLKDFFVLEIYEMKTMDRPFKEFKFSATELIDKRFAGKGTIRNTEDFKFKGRDARKYEADVPGNNGSFPVEVYAIAGQSRYYALFYTKFEKTDLIVKNIMNSMLLYK